MAKRRRRTDDKKLSKHERRKRAEERSKTRDEDYEEPQVTRRLEWERARTRRNDLIVIGVAVIMIVAVIGGYFIFYNYIKSEEHSGNGGTPTPSGDGNLYKRVVPGTSSSRPAYDGILKTSVKSLYMTSESVALDDIEYKSTVKSITLRVALEEQVLDKKYTIMPGTTVKLMNYEWEYVR